MKKTICTSLGLALLMASQPAAAAANNFALANNTGAAIKSLSIKRTGTTAWRPLGGSAAQGARTTIAFSDPDCAFDIKADLADGKSATYSGVNLCDVATVTLNRGSGGALWVDYD